MLLSHVDNTPNLLLFSTCTALLSLCNTHSSLIVAVVLVYAKPSKYFTLQAQQSLSCYVIKKVDVEKQLQLMHQMPELQEIHKATKASKRLIWSEEGPHSCTKYMVILLPFGDQLKSDHVSIK